MSNIVSVSDMAVMADSIVKSGFYGFKTKEQVMAVMLVAQAESKHPATVVQEYDIIQGRPALKSQAMLARFQLAGGTVQWDEVTPNCVKGTFKHPSGGSLTVEWTMAMAKQAGLVREGSGWTKYPEDMLRSRVISRAVRSVFPACILGHYAVEEVMDFEPKPKYMGNVERVEDLPQVDEVEVIEDGAFALFVPNSDQPYKRYSTTEDWIDGYAEMVSRISNSQKFSLEEKASKLASLAECNKVVTENFSTMDKVKLKGSIVQSGGTVSPKPDKSQQPPDSGLSEQTS